jgi:hypothetical protein
MEFEQVLTEAASINRFNIDSEVEPMFPYVWAVFPWLFLVVYLLFLYLDV